MECDRNLCYAAESCDKCEIKLRNDEIEQGKCVYPIEREVNQVLWFSVFTGPYEYGRDGNDFENDVFLIRSYDWSDEENNEYHFLHKPSGFKLQWYKYPLRCPYSNMEISHEDFLAVLRDCLNSLNEKVHYNINSPWWKK